MTDVVKAEVAVIGGGAAGAMAALAAARVDGVGVALVAGRPGATAFSSGAVDLAGDVSFTSLTPVRESMGRLIAGEPSQPLSRLGQVEGERLAKVVVEVLCVERDGRRLYNSRGLDQTHQLAVTALGHLHTCWLSQAGQVNLRGWPGRTVGVAEIVGSALPAWMITGLLGRAAAAAKLDAAFEPIDVQLPTWLDPGRPLLIARRLDDDETAVTRVGRAIADAVKERPVDVVLVPPWLGLDRTPAVVEALSEAAGVPVLEVLGRPGDPPGLRLHRLLEQATTDAGVEHIAGMAVTLNVSDDRVRSVEVRGGGVEVTLEAGVFVLATGGLAGGGIELGCAPTEVLLDLPLELDGLPLEPPASLYGAERSSFFETFLEASHPLCRAGVPCDTSLRPLRSGEPAFSNLFVAGSLLAEHDPTVGRSGLATALITGYRSGELAARDVLGE